MSASMWSEHGMHLGTLVGPVVLIAFWAGWADLRAWLHRRGDTLVPAALLAGLLSVGAAVAHLLVSPAHALEDPLYGAFFIAAAAAQLAWGIAILRRARPGLLAL